MKWIKLHAHILNSIVIKNILQKLWFCLPAAYQLSVNM